MLLVYMVNQAQPRREVELNWRREPPAGGGRVPPSCGRPRIATYSISLLTVKRIPSILPKMHNMTDAQVVGSVEHYMTITSHEMQ